MNQSSLFHEPTFGEVADYYARERLPQVAKSTASCHRSILALARVGLPDRPTSGDVLEFFNCLLRGDGPMVQGRSKKLLASTINAHRSVLHKVYEFGIRHRWRVAYNPIHDVPPLRVHDPAPRALRDDAHTMVRLAAVCPTATDRALLWSLRLLGLRIGEGLGLEPRHVRFDRGEVLVEQQRSEMGFAPGPLKVDTAKATLPLPAMLAQALRDSLRERMTATGYRPGTWFQSQAGRRYLFPHYNERLKALMADFRKVSAEDFPLRVVGEQGAAAWHVFRHTYGTELVNRNLPLEQVQLHMRHADVSTTAGYVASIRGRVLNQELTRGVQDAWAQSFADAEAALQAQKDAAAAGQGPAFRVVRGAGESTQEQQRGSDIRPEEAQISLPRKGR